MKNNYRDDGIVWFDDQICEIADLLIGVQGIRFVYLKKRDRSWIYRLGDDEMRYAFLQMTEMQLRIIEELLFEDKTITDIRREFDLTITEIRMEVREMRKLLIAAM
jgi:gluconate kinase